MADVLDNLTLVPENDTGQATLTDDPFETVPAGADLELLGGDLTISRATQPEPVGKSWMFDWGKQQFYLAGGRSPVAVRGQLSLMSWIEKCLHTDLDATPVSPPGYGLEGGVDAFGIGTIEGIAVDLAQRVHDALTFHPRIVDVTGFRTARSVDGAEVEIAMTIVLDDGDEVPFAARVS